MRDANVLAIDSRLRYLGRWLLSSIERTVLNTEDAPPARHGRATLKRISEITGLHVSTVSRVLRQSEPPDGWTNSAQLIRATAEDLGYQPNPWAASLRTRQTRILGAVMPRLTDGVVATMFEGIQEAADAMGYSVILSSPADTLEEMRKAVDIIMSRQVDGLLLSSLHTPGKEFLNSLDLDGAPVILLNRHAECEVEAVTNDDFHGGELVAELLITLGHRKYGVIAGPPHASSANDRVRGFLAGLRKSGIVVNPDQVAASGFEVSGGILAGRTLLTRADRPTAIFAINDTAAIGALGVARDLGIAVPAELSIVGFNDSPVSAQLSIALTTVRSQPKLVGETAVGLLLRKIVGEPVSSAKLGVELIVRGSTARASR